MIMKDLLASFLSKSEMNKLEIIELLIYKGQVTFAEIDGLFDLSRRSTKQLVTSLVSDLYAEDEKTPVIIEENILYFSQELDLKEKENLFIQLKCNYAKNSSLYRLIEFQLEKRTSSIISIAHTLNYSYSYSYKLIDKANDLFSSLALDFYIQKKQTDISIVGDEIDIRFFHYIFSLMMIPGNGWPFLLFSKQKVYHLNQEFKGENYDSLSESNQLKYLALLTISLENVRKKRYVQNIPKEIIEIYLNLKGRFAVSPLAKDKEQHSISKEFENEENVFFYILLLQVIPEVIKEDEKVLVGNYLENLLDNPLVNTAKKIVEEMHAILNFTPKQYALMFYETLSKTITIKVLKLVRFHQPISLNHSLKEVGAAIQQRVEACLHEEFLGDELRFVSFHLSQVASSYVYNAHKEPLKIYIEFYFQALNKTMIENYISYTYSTEAVQIVANLEDADVVISETLPDNLPPDVDLLLFSNMNKEQNWQSLGTYIQNKIIEETFS